MRSAGHLTASTSALLLADEHLRPLVRVLRVSQPAMMVMMRLLLLVGQFAWVAGREHELLVKAGGLVALRPSIKHLKRV